MNWNNPEWNDQILAQRLGLSIEDFGLLQALDDVLVMKLTLAAIKPFDVPEDLDDTRDISNIARDRVQQLKDRNTKFNQELQQFLPRDDEESLGPGWAIRTPTDGWDW